MKTAIRNSNWETKMDLTVFDEFQGDLAAECAAISRALRSQDKHVAASKMMVEQLSATSEQQAVQALCQDILAYCTQLEATGSLALLTRALQTRLSVVDRARDFGLVGLAQQAQTTTMAKLQDLSKASGMDWPTFAPKLSVLHTLQQLRSTSPPETLETLANELIGQQSYALATMILTVCITSAFGKANRLADQDSARKLRGLLSGFMELHRHTTRTVYFEAEALVQLLALTNLKMKTYEDTLDEVSSFKLRAPHFDVPTILERFYSAAINAAREIDRGDLVAKYEDAHGSAFAVCPMQQVPTEISQVIIKTQKEAKDQSEWGRNALLITLLWAEEEYKLGVLSEDDWMAMFGFYTPKRPPPQLNPTFESFLACVRRDGHTWSFYDSYLEGHHDEWVARFGKLREWLQRGSPRLPKESRLLVLKTIATAWGFKQRLGRMSGADQGPDDMYEDASLLTELGVADESAPPSMVGLPFQIQRKADGLLRNITNVEESDQAINDCEDVFQEYFKRQNRLGMHTALTRQANLLWDKFAKFHATGPDEALGALLRAERVYDDVRRDRSIPSAHHHSVAGKIQQLGKFDAAGMYHTAIFWNRIAWNFHRRSLWNTQAAVEAERNNISAVGALMARINEQDTTWKLSYSQFVSWTQKSKSRAIMDLLGIDAPIPADLLRQCEEAPSANALVEREEQLTRGLDKSEFPRVLEIREELNSLRTKMREEPGLKEIMSIRDGDTVTLGQISDALNDLPDGIILVDFIYVDFDKPLRAICYRKGLTYFPTLMWDVSWDTLTPWLENLKPLPSNTLRCPRCERPSIDPLRSRLDCAQCSTAALAELSPILSPLFKVDQGGFNQSQSPVIRKGDTIIFCPTGIMHRLPLHAIPIDHVPVIEKHPVVYCPSLTVLIHCLQTVKVSQQQSPTKRFVLNPMPAYWDEAEEEPVKSTPVVRDIATNLGAKYTHGWNLDKQSVTTSLQDVALFHYHGHVDFKKGAAMKSCIRLGETTDIDSDSANNHQLTAEDLFECSLSKPALATIVACQSGVADVSAADDVLGLPMALYYAGATATVGSLWKLQDEDGAAWGRAFYDDLAGQGEGLAKLAVEGEEDAGFGGMNGLVNFAVATQKSVQRLRFDDSGVERTPYHWAGYVLSGSWLFPASRVCNGSSLPAEGENTSG